MGTPDFAVDTLQGLVENEFDVVAVVTAPDKPTGRGLKVSESPVKKYAVSRNIPVLQPEKLKSKDFLAELESFKADLQVVVAFRMLPEVVWSKPAKGTINLHGSLLPQYRGAAPINWAIINGEEVTGVSTFFIEKEIDTGKIIYTEPVEIGPEDSAGDLHDRMMNVGAELVVKTVKSIIDGNYPSVSQNYSAELKSAPKIFKDTCKIDWTMNSVQLHNFIRGLSPYPTAWTTLGDRQLKIFEVKTLNEVPDGLQELKLGEIVLFTDHKKRLIVKAGSGFVDILVLQLEGKKRMTADEFLRGYRFGA